MRSFTFALIVAALAALIRAVPVILPAGVASNVANVNFGNDDDAIFGNKDTANGDTTKLFDGGKNDAINNALSIIPRITPTAGSIVDGALEGKSSGVTLEQHVANGVITLPLGTRDDLPSTGSIIDVVLGTLSDAPQLGDVSPPGGL